MDYSCDHLQKDADKLVHSEVPVPYLLHLSRLKVTDQAATEELLCAPGGALRTAYVHIDPNTGTRRWKHVRDSVISTA